MNDIILETTNIMQELPEEDQKLLHSIAQKLIKAWDPEFTKLTSREESELKEAIDEVNRGEYVKEKDIKWD